jgi:protein tyrosine phosphatase (PTP) superfamily phosphohydrolase (DUF442 family)
MRSSSITAKCGLAFVLLAGLSLSGCCSSVSRERAAVACAGSPGPAIPRFCIATPDILWAGARPDQNDASWLIQQGIRTVVDLELLHNDRSAFAEAIVPASKTYQLDYFRVRDWEPLPMVAPKLEDERVTRVLAIATKEPGPLFVHCRCGMKRTSLMVAAYRVVIEGVSAEKAIHEMVRYGGAWSGPDTRYILSLAKRRDEMQKRVAAFVPIRDAQVVCTDGHCSVSDH